MVGVVRAMWEMWEMREMREMRVMRVAWMTWVISARHGWRCDGRSKEATIREPK